MFPAPIKGYKFGIFDCIMDCYYLVADLLRHRAEIFMKNKFGSGIRVLSKFKFGSNQVRFHTIRKSPTQTRKSLNVKIVLSCRSYFVLFYCRKQF